MPKSALAFKGSHAAFFWNKGITFFFFWRFYLHQFAHLVGDSLSLSLYAQANKLLVKLVRRKSWPAAYILLQLTLEQLGDEGVLIAMPLCVAGH